MTLKPNHVLEDVERVRRRTRASPDAPLRHFSIPGHAFRSVATSDQPSSWQEDPNILRVEPRAARRSACEADPQEPPPTPLHDAS